MGKLDKVIEFLEKLKESLGKDYLIAGGCARDIYHGRTPKDYDVLFDNKTDFQEMQTAISKMDVNIVDSFNFHSGNKHFDVDSVVSCCSSDDRIMFGIKVKLEGDIEVDLLIYNCAELLEIPKMFDYNINQFAINTSRKIFMVDFLGEHIPCLYGLQPVRGLGDSPRDIKRKEKMKALAIELGYRTNE